jgi:hypothetical protein
MGGWIGGRAACRRLSAVSPTPGPAASSVEPSVAAALVVTSASCATRAARACAVSPVLESIDTVNLRGGIAAWWHATCTRASPPSRFRVAASLVATRRGDCAHGVHLAGLQHPPAQLKPVQRHHGAVGVLRALRGGTGWEGGRERPAGSTCDANPRAGVPTRAPSPAHPPPAPTRLAPAHGAVICRPQAHESSRGVLVGGLSWGSNRGCEGERCTPTQPTPRRCGPSPPHRKDDGPEPSRVATAVAQHHRLVHDTDGLRQHLQINLRGGEGEG